jgi:hypothetical protein
MLKIETQVFFPLGHVIRPGSSMVTSSEFSGLVICYQETTTTTQPVSREWNVRNVSVSHLKPKPHRFDDKDWDWIGGTGVS